MYIFFHLIAGIIIGLLIVDILHDRRWLIPCAIGAVLPDLLDKPIGYVLLPGVVGYGRLIFHSLSLSLLLLAAGLLLWKYRGSVLVLAAGIGILSHQLIDAMWRSPVNWLDPLLGPLAAHRPIPPDYLLLLLRQDLEDPSEWFFVAVFAALIVLYLEWKRVSPVTLAHRDAIRGFLKGSGILLWVVSAVVLAFGLLRRYLGLHGRFGLDDLVVLSAVIGLTAFLSWRWGSSLDTDPVPVPG